MNRPTEPKSQQNMSRGASDGVRRVKRFKDSTGRVKVILPNSKHGTVSCYVSGCRRPECRHAATLYEREHRVRMQLGLNNPIVDAGRARRHLLKLQKQGLGQKRVGLAAGVRHQTIWEVRAGVKRRIRKETQDKILTVRASDGRLTTPERNERCWKMIDHLVDLGFPKTWIAEHTHWKPSGNLKHGLSKRIFQYERSRRFHVNTAERIEQLYEQLKRHGWLTPEDAKKVRVARRPKKYQPRQEVA